MSYGLLLAKTIVVSGGIAAIVRKLVRVLGGSEALAGGISMGVGNYLGRRYLEARKSVSA